MIEAATGPRILSSDHRYSNNEKSCLCIRHARGKSYVVAWNNRGDLVVVLKK